ncbi:MAG: hypothetical protein ACOYYF_08180 [Chloroflexota bacterium]|nr:hypothetical protein [Chloroflexota bacterium]MBI5704808.1 hypothetical protein [Chloroflexota bacterium]
MNPYLATLLTFAIAIAFLRLMDLFAQRGWINSKLTYADPRYFVFIWRLF